jgi:hypothetical protein
VSTIEELLRRIVAAIVQKADNTAPRGSVAMTTRYLLSAKLALISPTSGGRSIGIIRSQAKATEFVLFYLPER